MSDTSSKTGKYFLTFALGIVAGGIVTIYATKALPKMMSSMMQDMMDRMGGEGCSPVDI